MKEMIGFEIAIMVYKSLRGLAPNSMQLIFTKLSETIHCLSVIPIRILEYRALQPHRKNVVAHSEA